MQISISVSTLSTAQPQLGLGLANGKDTSSHHPPPPFLRGEAGNLTHSSLGVLPRLLLQGAPHWGPALSSIVQQGGPGQVPTPHPYILATPGVGTPATPPPYRPISHSASSLLVASA